MIIGGAAQQRDRAIGVQAAQLLPPQALDDLARFAPRLHPTAPLFYLFRRPAFETHEDILPRSARPFFILDFGF